MHNDFLSKKQSHTSILPFYDLPGVVLLQNLILKFILSFQYVYCESEKTILLCKQVYFYLKSMLLDTAER